MNNNHLEFTKLYEAYYKDVYYVVMKLVKNEEAAKDITQDTFIKAYENLETLRSKEKVKGWLLSIANHRAIDYLRHQGVIKMESLDQEETGTEILDDKAPIPADIAVEKDVSDILMKLVDQLSEEQRITLFMYYYEDLSVHEIAKICECSEKTVYSRLTYAKKNLRKYVEQVENEGLKLRTIAILPFLYVFFANECNAYADMTVPVFAMPDSASVAGTTAGKNAGGTGSTAGNNAGITVGATVKASAGIGAGKLAAIIAGSVAAVGLIVGGIIFAVRSNDQPKHKNNPVDVLKDSEYQNIAETSAYDDDSEANDAYDDYDSDNIDEEEKDDGFEIYDVIVNTPLIKLEDKELKINDKIFTSDEYDFYAIGVTAYYGFDYATAGDNENRLEGINEEMTDIWRYDYLEVSKTEEEKYNMDLEKYRTKFFYYIRYVVEKDTHPDVKLIEYRDKEIVTLSDGAMSGNIVSSGEAYPGDTLLLTDEYGMEHYFIPLTAGGYIDGETIGRYEICFAQLGKYHSVFDEENVAWNMEETTNLEVTFGNCSYVKADEENNHNNTVQVADTYSNEIDSLVRDNGIYSFWLHVDVTQDNADILYSGSDIHMKINDVDFIIDPEWDRTDEY